MSGKILGMIHSKVSVLSVLFVAVLTTNIASQSIGKNSTTSPERGTANPGRSFTLSDIETINNYSGDVMFNVPIGSLPAGRGGLSAGLTLNYSSKIWDMKTFDLESTVTHHDRNVLSLSEEGNWRYQYGYRLKLEAMMLGESDGACINGNITPWKLFLILPDGSKHALFLDGYTGEEGFMNVLPDGRSACPSNQYPANISSTVTYFTTDGTYLRLDMLQDSDNPSSSDPEAWGNAWKNNTWVLYMPDGSLVTGNPDPASHPEIVNRIYDRNANYLDIVELTSDPSYSNHRTTSIKDQLGRKIVIEYNSATDQDSIHAPGVGGTDLVTKVTWKNIHVNKTYYSCDIDYPGSGGTPDLQNWPLNKTVRVVDKVYVPVQLGNPSTDDMYYTFSYNADNTSATDTGWGEVSQVTMPSGAVAAYEYYYDSVSGSTVNPDEILLNRPVEKNVTYDLEYDLSSSTTTDTWTYTPTATYNVLSNLTSVTVKGPDGSSTTEHYSLDWDKRGEVYKTEASNGTIVEKLWVTNSPMPTFATDAKTNRFVRYEFTTIADSTGSPAKTAIREFVQDKNGNTTEVKEYDFYTGALPRDGGGKVTGLPTSGLTLKRITKTAFHNGTPAWDSTTYNDADSYWLATSPRLLNLAKSVEVQNGSATPKSRSELTYDYTDYSSSNTVGGNLTQTKVWDSYKGGSARTYSNPLTTTNSFTTSAGYDSYGNPISTTDANGNVVSITYGSIGGYSDLYPTQTVSAYGTGVARTTQTAYDFSTGLTTSTTDADNGITNSAEYDDLGRPTTAISANGTALESWTTTTYYDADRYVVVKSDLETKGDGKKVATQFYDQLGRVRLSKTLEDAATQFATNETDGIKVQTRYLADNPNAYHLTSNPYRAATAIAATNETTMGWTRSKSANTGKHSEVETFSGAALPAPWGSNANSTGIVQTDIDANATTMIDQAGKLRRSISNALGQLIRVDEPNSSNQLGSVTSPNQATYYSYDTLGKMTRVQQGVQNRYFMYDSLGRTLRVRQPEQEVNSALNTTGNPDNNSWTAGFTYDNNGSALTTTDAKGTTITSTYDALNRPLTRTYSDGTPTVTNYYDGAGLPSVPQFSKGKLTKVDNSISESRYTQFDLLGRITQCQQITDGQTYTSGFQYNLSGALVEETYPSGRKVKNEFETDGQLSKVESMKAGSTIYRPFVSNMVYNPAGMISQMRYGNGRWETTKFNARLQMTELGLGNSATDTSVWKNNYEYGELQTNGTVDSVKNSGNVAKQNLTVPGTSFVQAYKYDEVYRLTEAKETSGSTQNWIQQFVYDRYGNRTSFNQSIGQQNQTQTPTIDVNTNRFNPNQGFAYDKNGNIINDIDASSSLTRQFIFNGENKQIEVKKDGVTIGRYYYDGEGKRVKKITDVETTVFVYSGGKMIAEYSTQLSQTPSTSYLTNDHLGSPRAVTNELGQVKARRDFMPFGEELFVNVGGRTAGLQYGASDDDVRQKFAGYQKDAETDLDFAEARMYEDKHGRFTAIDPLLASGKSNDPQSFNRYIYVMNDPIKFIDPNGKCTAPSGLKAGQVGICFEAFIKAKNIGPGGIGHGDNRGFSGNDPNSTARVTVWGIASTNSTAVGAEKVGERVEHSVVGGGNANVSGTATGPDGSSYRVDTGINTDVSLPGTASTDVKMTRNDSHVGESDFGKSGIDVTVSIANGTNGGQQLGKDMQLNGAITGGAPGLVIAGAGKAVEALSPAGTIDGNVTVRITGNGKVEYVGGESRGYPSYAAYAYTVGSDGKIVTQEIIKRTENKIEDLTKPMKPF